MDLASRQTVMMSPTDPKVTEDIARFQDSDHNEEILRDISLLRDAKEGRSIFNEKIKPVVH